ncbi:thioredoxin family protein [Sphaerotilus sp.]|uniref:thioredoxin family protein n=1 Tax=Sphaerotilus sp. TaxID=2093942 RepID=UPI002ACD5B3A|nr:thioredoxin family protein [Sphaerotilus sp.]MDZ7855022.1 thioredoxin family protein [Sphaerotilus sp.]
MSTPPPALPAPLTVACLCAGWCVACQAYAATFAQVAQAHPDVCFTWVDIEDHSDALGDEALDIENFPTLLVLKRLPGKAPRPLFLGTVMPHAGTLERMVQAAQAGSMDGATVRTTLAAPVAALTAALHQGVNTAN